MPYVEYVCEGRVLFRSAVAEEISVVPRLHELVVLDERPFQVVDVEYWSRRLGASDRRTVWPVVHVLALSDEEWEHRRTRRFPRADPPLRY